MVLRRATGWRCASCASRRSLIESDYDKLGTLIREAITAASQEGYQTGRYAWDLNSPDDERKAALDAAKAASSEATRKVWKAFYDYPTSKES